MHGGCQKATGEKLIELNHLVVNRYHAGMVWLEQFFDKQVISSGGRWSKSKNC
jgi:hypothetical protein